jgi:hypothetical protein
MKRLFLFSLPIALAGSPATSATYFVDGFSTGLPQRDESSGNTPASVHDGGNTIGFGGSFSASATNVGGGFASAYASEGISDINLYVNGIGAYPGQKIVSYGLSSVMYTIRIDGPTTGALIPVHVTMFAYVGNLSIPGPAAGYDYVPLTADVSAGVGLNYANNDNPLPYVVVDARYDYRYFTEGDAYVAPSVESKSDSFDGVVMMAANEDIKVGIDASANLVYSDLSPVLTETAVGSAYADPSFEIDDPAYADYTITGVPTGPAAVATPEASTWAMMLMGFAGLGFLSYRRSGRRPAAIEISRRREPA